MAKAKKETDTKEEKKKKATPLTDRAELLSQNYSSNNLIGLLVDICRKIEG